MSDKTQPSPDLADLGKAAKSRGRVGTGPQQQQQQQPQGQQQGRKCARCGAAFGRFYNTGAPCPRCRQRVCRQCRGPTGPDWQCSLCNKLHDLRSVSAELRRSTGRDNYLSALDILKYSIRRAWTINGPPARWSVSRKSAEFRPYRSLPNRRRDYLEYENSKNSARKPQESLIRPPRIITKTPKQNESKRSNIPVFRHRSSREFEDIRGPHESPKRSLIPQRYRGSTDDLRRSREDISIPSFIPKLLSPRGKEDRPRRPEEPRARQQQEARPAAPAPRPSRRDEPAGTGAPSASAAGGAKQECTSATDCASGRDEKEMLEESRVRATDKNREEAAAAAMAADETDKVPLSSEVDTSGTELRTPDDRDELSVSSTDEATAKELDKTKSDTTTAKKSDEPIVVKRKFSKEELSNEDTDDTHNRRCSSHLSPEASPLSTRSSRYSPRESESEPTPALPRRLAGESSSASQRIRDAITRTRRESNSSAKYESSGSEGVRLSESGLSSYTDIARRVKLFGSGSIGPSTGSCDEVLHRDSATSAGEDDHEDLCRDPSRAGSVGQSRVMLRRRRQFDAQGPRRRGRSHARSCCGAEDPQSCVRPDEEPVSGAALLDYRRLVFISSDSSSGREEDDADSSCSGSSYLNGQAAAAGQQSGATLEDCDWDYFESNSLKLPQLQPIHQQPGPAAPAADWSCCPARPVAGGASAASGCCQACGGSKSAKVLPVPVPIPVPVPYPVPVPASLWTGEFGGLERARAAANSMIGRDTRLEQSLPLSLRGDPGSAATWFTWNPRFDTSSLLFSQPHIFTRELSTSSADALLQPEKQEEKPEPEPQICEKPEASESSALNLAEPTEEIAEPPAAEVAAEPPAENQPQPRMFRHSQEQDSRSSSGRSSADSSDLEDSAASHRFSRVLIVNDDSLTSDNDVEDNDDSDSAREGRPVIMRCLEDGNARDDTAPDDEAGPVVLRRIRLLDEDADLDRSDDSRNDEENDEKIKENIIKKRRGSNSDEEYRREIESYDEIYLASTQDASEDLVLLKSIKSIDPEAALSSPRPPPVEQDEVSLDEEEEEESSNDSALMPDSLEVSMQELEDSIEALPAVGATEEGGSSSAMLVGEEKCSGARPVALGSSSGSNGRESSAAAAALMAKSRKKWQIPASFDIKGIPSTHFLPAERRREPGHANPLLLAAEELRPRGEDDEYGEPNANGQDAEEEEEEEEAAAEDAASVTASARDESGGQVGGGGGSEPAERRAAPARGEEDAPRKRRDWVAPEYRLNNNAQANGNKYRSLVMITQAAYQPVNVVTSDTTTLLQPAIVHQQQAGYFQLGLDAGQELATRRNIGPSLGKKPLPCKRLLPDAEVDSGLSVGSASESDDVQSVKTNNSNNNSARSPILLPPAEEYLPPPLRSSSPQEMPYESATPRSRGPVILEEGLADDDSWVEEISHDEDEQSVTTATEESSEDEAIIGGVGDREEELRGYHRQAIDFTLHTIVEESCEESESEHASGASWRRRLASNSAPDLDKYFFFGLGADGKELDSLSESSSIFSEGLDSLAREEAAQSASQEKSEEREDRRDSDGSVGSDSEGRPSPEAQRRKRLVRARGTGRSHSSSLDNLLALAHSAQNSLQDSGPPTDGQESQSEGSSTETDGADENPAAAAFGNDGQFDTVKRKKKKLRNPGAQSPRVTEDRNKTPEPSLVAELPEEEDAEGNNSEEDGAKTPQPESVLAGDSASEEARSKTQSRDSGFVGSCDDLLLTPSSRSTTGETPSLPEAGEPDAPATPETAQAQEQQRRNPSSIHERLLESQRLRERLTKMEPPGTASGLSRKDSFNNWSSDEETNLMMSKMRQFFKTMVATNAPVGGQQLGGGGGASSAQSPAPSPSPRFSKGRPAYGHHNAQNNRTKPPQLVYFENELTRLMKTVPGIRDEQVREIVEYLSSEETWSDSYDSSDYTSSDLEGAAVGGRRSALQEQISQSCQQIIDKFDTSAAGVAAAAAAGAGLDRREAPAAKQTAAGQQACLGRDTAFVYQKLVQSFTKMAGDNVPSDASSTPHSSPPLIAKVMHHIGSRLVALMHEVSESNSTAAHSHAPGWRRYPHRTPSSASTTEDDDSTSDSAGAPTLPRSKSHDPLLLINGHAGGATSMPPTEAEEREASDYERFSWRGSFESALMAADSRTKLSLLACSGDVGAASAMAAKRRSAGDLLFNPKSFSREQLDRVRSCGSIGGAVATGNAGGPGVGGSIEEKIWSNRRRSSVPDANTRGESGASGGDEDTEDEDDDELAYHHQHQQQHHGGDPRATTLPRGVQAASAGVGVGPSGASSNSLPRQTSATAGMHKAHSVYHFLPQHSAVKSARYRPPGFARNSPGCLAAAQAQGPKRAFSAPGLQLPSRTRRQNMQQHSPNASASSANVSVSTSISADEASLSEACSTPIIGASSRNSSSHASMDLDDIDRSLHLATRASLSSLGARSDSMASVYSGAGEGRWCGSVAVRGEVEFSLQYDYKQLTFEVHVTQCRDLAPVDVKRNRSDPYVKVYLLPDKSKSGKRKTKVKKHTLNPVFDETLKFHTSLNSLESRTLWLTVWHSDMFGRNDFLGEVRMPLENKIFDDPRPQWYPLQERTEPFDDPVACKGEVIVGLKFVPPDPTRPDRDRDTLEQRLNKAKKSWSKGSLHVLVKEARSLQTRAKNSGTCDPFCKSYLLPDKGRSGKQKTGVVRRSTGSATWNHTFVYKDVSLQELAERGLELTVWDHDRIASNEFLGGVRFNLGTGKHYGKTVDWMDATGREMSLWQNMLERPNFWVEGVVTLRPNLHNHVKTGTS